MKTYCLKISDARPVIEELPEQALSVSAANRRVDGRICSGFSRWQQPDSLPVSPTMQLNCDSVFCPSETALRIALAEEQRQIHFNVPVFEVHVPARAAVVADDEQGLNAFLETWGGCMEAATFLISEDQQTEFTAVSDIGVEPAEKGGGCVVVARGRAPVNMERCTRCGKCGAACGLQCIDPDLRIDFSRCTFCNDCARACGEDAIDIYAVFETRLDVPAVIVVGEPELGINPACSGKVFSASAQMPEFFKRVGTWEVEEQIGFEECMCLYDSRLDIGCVRCTQVCPVRAVSGGKNGISIRHLECTGCGSCTGSCPTGALQYQAFSDRSFLEWFEKAELAPGFTLVVGDEDALMDVWWYSGADPPGPAIYLEYPGIGGMHLMHLLFLFAIGAARVILLQGKDVDKDMMVADQVSAANKIIHALFGVDGFILPATLENLSGLTATPTPDRGSLPVYADFTFGNRRSKLVSILKFLYHASGAEGVTLEDESLSTFGSIRCDVSRCTACLSCLNVCRTGSLVSDASKYQLLHNASLCIQCGACSSVCPEGALSLVPGLSLDEEWFESVVIYETEPMICRDCGARFGTRESYNHIVAVLREKGLYDQEADVLEYCETCRARRMFER